MNRQQRRLMARQKAVEQKYLSEIYDRQNKVDDRQVELTIVCIGLALNKLYGWNGRGIGRVTQEFANQLHRVYAGETYENLAKELYAKTEIEFKLGSREEVSA